MYKFSLRLILLIFTSLIFTPSVLAAQSLSITNIPSTIDRSQEFSINASLVCSGCSDSYLRGVFYPSGTSYFGYTQDNNGNWSNAPGSGCTTYFKIAQSDLQGGSWSGVLKFKPDKDSPYYNGPGEYLFKVGRYTSSCSSPSVWSTETTIAITGPTPTPTPSPISTPIPTSSPTSVPTVTPRPTSTPTIKPSISPVNIVTPSPTLLRDVLGEQDVSTSSEELNSSLSPTDSPSASSNKGSSHQNIILIFIFIIAGSLIACAVGYFAFDRFNSPKDIINQL